MSPELFGEFYSGDREHSQELLPSLIMGITRGSHTPVMSKSAMRLGPHFHYEEIPVLNISYICCRYCVLYELVKVAKACRKEESFMTLKEGEQTFSLAINYFQDRCMLQFGNSWSLRFVGRIHCCRSNNMIDPK